MTSKKLISSLIVAAVIIGFIVILYLNNHLQENYGSSNSVHINIGYVPVTSSLPTFVALANGYFIDAGFNVTSTSYPDSNQLAEAISNGNEEVAGYVSTDPIFALSQKDPNLFKIIGEGVLDKSSPFTALLVSNDSKLTLNDLSGKKVGMFPGSTAKILTNIAFSKMFGHTVNYQAVPMPPTLWLPALANNQVQYVLSYEPFATLGTQQGSVKILYPGLVENFVMNDMPSSVVVVTSKFAEKNPQETKEIAGVYKRAIDFINSNPNQARIIATHYMPIDEQVSMKTNLNSWYVGKNMNTTALQEYDNILVKYGELQTSVNASNMIYGN